jgi:uncharacterized protein YmfQ (DUF2313 family)
MKIPTQPTLPAEQPFTNLEEMFVQESPPGLWPENQNSNFGILRKTMTDLLQDSVDELDQLFNEMFANTAVQYLSRWEREYGIPVAPSKAAYQRQTFVLQRLRKGAFTRANRNRIIEDYIRMLQSGGTPITLTAPGIEMVAGGVPIYAEGVVGSAPTLYTIVETPTNFSYQVRIKNTVTIDIDYLNRELQHFTPAGVTWTVVSVADPFQVVTATRTGVRMALSSTPLNMPQGWFAIRYTANQASSYSTSNSGLFEWARTGLEGTERIASWIISGNMNLAKQSAAGGAIQSVPVSFASGATITVIGAWTPDETKISFNGAPFVHLSQKITPTLLGPTVVFGGMPGAVGVGADLKGTFVWAVAGEGKLTDADAATINSFGNTVYYPYQYPGIPTIRWNSADANAWVART